MEGEESQLEILWEKGNRLNSGLTPHLQTFLSITGIPVCKPESCKHTYTRTHVHGPFQLKRLRDSIGTQMTGTIYSARRISKDSTFKTVGLQDQILILISHFFVSSYLYLTPLLCTEKEEPILSKPKHWMDSKRLRNSRI